MESIKWLDFLLGTLVLAVVPLFLAAYGGHLAAQSLPDPKKCRNAKRKHAPEIWPILAHKNGGRGVTLF
jgi:hypothetical protein